MKPVYIIGGYNTIAFGPGRKEFNPADKKAFAKRPHLEDYLLEAGRETLKLLDPEFSTEKPSKVAQAVDLGIVTNFMAARYCKQGNLAAFIPMIHPDLQYKPAMRVEGACGSGGLGIVAGINSISAGEADIVLVIGVEEQNTVKAVYGADYLAGAAHIKTQRHLHAHLFPYLFSVKTEIYMQDFGQERVRKAMAQWYVNSVENARRNPKAQEFHNEMKDEELLAYAMMSPDPKRFTEYLNYADCSKVTDAASGLLLASEEGINKLGEHGAVVEIASYGTAVAAINLFDNKPELKTTKRAVEKVIDGRYLNRDAVGYVEIHDCFSISGLLSLEAAGFAEYGGAVDIVLNGKIKKDGELPVNATGGLVGYGHPVGATGVRQAVDIYHQLTSKAGECQIKLNKNKPFALSVNMGGCDKTVTAILYR
jgi:acetyl-CoA C-acetyltransferase/acetyl-CoA acyltransferase